MPRYEQYIEQTLHTVRATHPDITIKVFLLSRRLVILLCQVRSKVAIISVLQIGKYSLRNDNFPKDLLMIEQLGLDFCEPDSEAWAPHLL